MSRILTKDGSNNLSWRDESATSGFAKLMKSGSSIGWHLAQDEGLYLHKDGSTVGWRNKTFVIMYTVTWNAQGGAASEASRQVAQNTNIGTLPTAERANYIFGGWFTAPTGGLKIDANYTVNSPVTFYARWGQTGGDIDFGDATTQFNMAYLGGPTNYSNNPYTLYAYNESGSQTSNVIFQTAISSPQGKVNDVKPGNSPVTLYLKVTNSGPSGYFHIGFDADSMLTGNDDIRLTRTSEGYRVGPWGSNPGYYVSYTDGQVTCWVGQYSNRTSNRLIDSSIGTAVGSTDSSCSTGSVLDTGFTFTMRDVYINTGSYAILVVTFTVA